MKANTITIFYKSGAAMTLDVVDGRTVTAIDYAEFLILNSPHIQAIRVNMKEGA